MPRETLDQRVRVVHGDGPAPFLPAHEHPRSVSRGIDALDHLPSGDQATVPLVADDERARIADSADPNGEAPSITPVETMASSLMNRFATSA